MVRILKISFFFRCVLLLLVVIPIFLYRDFTLDNELRYLSIADEALRNGNFFAFYNHGLLYADKPPLYLWIIMLGKWLFGHHSMLFLAFFSFMPALVILAVMDSWVKDSLSEEERLTARLMLLTSLFFLGHAVVLRMDMLMCMFIVLALRTFYKLYTRTGKPLDAWLFPVYLFLSLFIKGPVGIIVPLLSTIVFLAIKKELRFITKYWGIQTILILLFLCSIWFTAAYFEGGSRYLNELVFHQTIGRAVNAFHHEEPFYYYFLAFWYALAPWSLFIAGSLMAGFRKYKTFSDTELFFRIAALSTFVILSLFSSKIAVYLLPAFPFFVYLSVLGRNRPGSASWIRWSVGIPAILFVLAFPDLLLAGKFFSSETDVSLWVCLAAVLLSGTGILTFFQLLKQRINQAIIVMSLGILLSIFTVSFSVPKYNRYIGLSEICRQAQKAAVQRRGENYFYCEIARGDNLDVYLGKNLTQLKIKDLYRNDSLLQKPAILFTWDKAIERNDSLRAFIQNKKTVGVGGYYYIEIGEPD